MNRHSISQGLACSAALAVWLLAVSGAPAYSLQGSKWPQPGGLGSPLTITYSFNNLLNGGLLQPDEQPLPIALIRQSVEEALGLWSSVAPLNFVQVPDQGWRPAMFANYPDGQFGQIRLSHLYINGPDEPGQDPTTKAMAFYPGYGNNLSGDVLFDNGDPWQEVGTLHQPDLLGAAIHELGHALGLGHSDNPQANMYYVFTRYSGLGTGALHPDDIAGIRAIYGPGVGSVVPMELPSVPEPSTGLLLTLAALGGWLMGRRRVTLTQQVVSS